MLNSLDLVIFHRRAKTHPVRKEAVCVYLCYLIQIARSEWGLNQSTKLKQQQWTECLKAEKVTFAFLILDNFLCILIGSYSMASLKMGKPQPLFVYFRTFQTQIL